MMDAAQIEKLWRRDCAMLEGFINDRDEEIARLREALNRVANIAASDTGTFSKIVAIAEAILAGPEKPIRANFPPFDHRNLRKRGGR